MGPVIFGILVIGMGFVQVLFRRVWGNYAHQTWKSLGIKSLERSPQFWSKVTWAGAAVCWLIGIAIISTYLLSN